jgi:hypothetical protein
VKKRDLEAQIATLARSHGVECVLVGGTKHDKYRFNGTVILIPRHREIGETLAAKILKDCHAAL